MAERSVNKAILVGRLGADAETRFTQNGTPVSRVSLAMNRQWTDSDKQVHEETDWMSIVIWNKENLATYLTKGSKLYVEGRLQTRSYDDKEGVKRYVTEVVAENLVLLGGTATAATVTAQAGEKDPIAVQNRPRPQMVSVVRNGSPKIRVWRTMGYLSRLRPFPPRSFSIQLLPRVPLLGRALRGDQYQGIPRRIGKP